MNLNKVQSQAIICTKCIQYIWSPSYLPLKLISCDKVWRKVPEGFLKVVGRSRDSHSQQATVYWAAPSHLNGFVCLEGDIKKYGQYIPQDLFSIVIQSVWGQWCLSQLKHLFSAQWNAQRPIIIPHYTRGNCGMQNCPWHYPGREKHSQEGNALISTQQHLQLSGL